MSSDSPKNYEHFKIFVQSEYYVVKGRFFWAIVPQIKTSTKHFVHNKQITSQLMSGRPVEC